MLDHEYELLIARLSATRGDNTKFFVFADTVATINFKGTNEAHGWLGIRFQTEPMGEPSEIVLHVRMWDKDALLQQQALGIVGVNLIYGALYYRSDPRKLIESLQDNLGTDRIEVDMLRFSGHCFGTIDNRLMSLHLVEFKLTNAVMFGQEGELLLESFGRLFRNAVKLYIYPMREETYERYIVDPNGPGTSIRSFASNVLINAKNVRIVDHLSSLYAHLLENHYIESIVGSDTNILNIFSRDVLKKIKDNDLLWETMVPIPVADAIKRRGLFGHANNP